MSGKKKHWRLSTPFQSLSPKQGPQSKAKVGRSGSHVSSVYLSDGSPTSGFVIVPEFDYPVPTQAAPGEPTHNSQGPNQSFSPLLPSDFVGDTSPEPIVPQSPHPDDGFFESQEDDLVQRLSVAYEHIRSMSSTSLRVSLSSDPHMLKKQLGVPQHSVFNYPTHSSLDLPNPHPSPLEPTSIGPPSPTLTPTSHATTSNKLGLRIDTNIDVYSPSQEPIRPTSTLTETSPSQRSTLGARWSTPAFRMSKSQDFIPSSSKLVKRRVEKTAHSPSSPHSDRQPLRGVLRKQNPSLVRTPDTHRRQISLPQIRPPSPFKVNIPLHHAWHDRRTDFNSSTKCHSDVLPRCERNQLRASGSTEVLASLAWIGASHTTNWRYSESTEFFPDHFNMEVAVEDDTMSDCDLVDRLEKARRINDFERGRIVPPPSGSSGNASLKGNEDAPSPAPRPSTSSPTSDQSCDVPLSSLIPKDTSSGLEDTEVWQAARKAFLCIREIVRTEKKYQEALKMLLNAQTTTPPPPSMSPYVAALVRVSELLLKRFLEDPSVWGVSTAFVTSEDELEASMVSWCAVAGAFFTDNNESRSNDSTGRWRLRKSGITSGSLSVIKQTASPLSPQLPPVFSTTSTAGKRTADECCTVRGLTTETKYQTGATSAQKLESTRTPGSATQPPCRKLSVRDLAIQPIQRVMRYVLLYRDLLNCTPAVSPPRLFVERALEAATRIANHCDRAQKNPAFYRGG